MPYNLEYSVEYPNIKKITRKDDKKIGYTWGKILWEFLESGREICKVTPPQEITPVNAYVGVHNYLTRHPEVPVIAVRRGGALYIFRRF